MRRELLDLIGCPSCASFALAVEQANEQDVEYKAGRIREIESGIVVCRDCGARYPVEGYVLSFAERLDPGVRSDGAFWGEFYRQHYEQGFHGFMDTTAEPVPFLTQGVPESIPIDSEEWCGVHVELAEHRVGVGAGWSSLFLARRGFEVIAFDPALELMQLAKRHAIACGIYLEYVCSDMANFHVREQGVDAVFALHSLHHVPDIEHALRSIHRMLRTGGCLALDDHLQDVRRNLELRHGLILEAEETIFPAYRKQQRALVLPSHHSENEGVGMGTVLQTVEKYLCVDDVRYRHINFDILAPLAYLKFNRSMEALTYTVQLVDFIHNAMRRMWPDSVEYMTLVAQKREMLPERAVFSPPPTDREGRLAQELDETRRELKRLHEAVAAKNEHIQRLERLIGRLENGRLMRLLRWVGRG
jgi:SAM-dependent methyltransferase